MSLKQVAINFTLDVEKHQVNITDCYNSCVDYNKIIALPVLTNKCKDCSDVVIKLKDSALVVPTCEDVPQKIIVARIKDYIQLVDGNGCPLSEFKITFEYDDAQLTTPANGIAPCDIEGFDCYTIATEYLKGIVDCTNAGTSLTQNTETGQITYTNGAGSAFVVDILSGDAGNVLEVGEDGGLYLSDAALTTTKHDIEVDTGGPIVVDTLGTYVLSTGALVSLFNDSTTATLRILLKYIAEVGGTFRPGHKGTLKLEATINGGAYIPFATKTWTQAGSISFVGTTIPISFNTTVLSQAVVAALGSYTIGFRLSYQTTSVGAGGDGASTIDSYLNTYEILGIEGNNV